MSDPFRKANLVNYETIIAQSSLLKQLPNNEYGHRFYQDATGVKYPSITTLCDILRDKNEKRAPQAVLQRTANLGTMIHSAIAQDLQGETPELDERIVAPFKKWKEFRLTHHFEPHMIELTVVSEMYGFAGTLDYAGLFTSCDNKECCKVDLKDEPVVIDFKTGRYSIKAGYQMAGYAWALHEMGDPLKRRLIGLQIHRSGDLARPFIYEHKAWCLKALLAALEGYKSIYFSDLAKMEWPYLHKNAFEDYLKGRDEA